MHFNIEHIITAVVYKDLALYGAAFCFYIYKCYRAKSLKMFHL